MKTIRGEDVSKLREKLGLTQHELAVKIGLKHRSQVAKIEGGQRQIRGPLKILLNMICESPNQFFNSTS